MKILSNIAGVLLGLIFNVVVEGALGDAAQVYLLARPEVRPLVTLRYRAVDEGPMLRMVLDPGAQVAAPHGGVRRVGPDDLGAIQVL